MSSKYNKLPIYFVSFCLSFYLHANEKKSVVSPKTPSMPSEHNSAFHDDRARESDSSALTIPPNAPKETYLMPEKSPPPLTLEPPTNTAKRIDTLIIKFNQTKNREEYYSILSEIKILIGQSKEMQDDIVKAKKEIYRTFWVRLDNPPEFTKFSSPTQRTTIIEAG